MIRALIAQPDFQGGLRHGLAIVLGIYAGLLLWALLLAPSPPPPVSLPSPSFAPVTLPWPASGGDANTGFPVPALIETLQSYGPLPIAREKGDPRRPFDAYRRPFSLQDLKTPVIALVVLDYGLSESSSAALSGQLPPEISYALPSSLSGGANWATKAHDEGHELWLELAVQPFDYPESDAGRDALMTASPLEKNRSALLTQLGRAVGYVGLLSRGDAPTFHSGADAEFLATNVFSRGLALVLNTNGPDSILRTIADKNAAPFYARPFPLLDERADLSSLSQSFDDLVQTAQGQGYAIGLIRPDKASITALKHFLENLPARGVILAPLSALAERGKLISP